MKSNTKILPGMLTIISWLENKNILHLSKATVARFKESTAQRLNFFMLIFLIAMGNSYGQSSCDLDYISGTLDFTYSGGTKTLTLVFVDTPCSSETLQISNYPTWATVTQLNSNTVQVVCDENTGAARNSSIFFKYDGHNVFKSITQGAPAAVPEAPPAPLIVSSPCGGPVVLGKNGSPSSGVSWIWQGTNSSGELTTMSLYLSTYEVTTSGTYYLRAYRYSSDSWSTTSSSIYVNVKPPATLWYDDSDGDGLGDPAITLEDCSRPTGYVSNADDQCPDWASSTNQCFPDAPPTPFVLVNLCGGALNSIGIAGTRPDGVKWFWQGTEDNATSTDNSTSAYPVSNSGTYYIRARNDAGYWSQASSHIDFVQKVVPDTPLYNTVSIQNDCGSTILSLTTSVPTGEEWYWQNTSGSVSEVWPASSPITLDDDTVHYLKAKNIGSGCWSSPLTIPYTVDQPVVYYADTDGDGFGDPNNTRTKCSQPTNYVGNSDDYDDTDELITNIAPSTFYLDNDGDTFGNPNQTKYQSIQPIGYVTDNTDCDDNAYSLTNDCTVAPPSSDPSDHNYVYTRTYQTERAYATSFFSADDGTIQNITYFDGLGRPDQQIGIGHSPDITGNADYGDIVTVIEYDAHGRIEKDWLPVPDSIGAIGSYRTGNMEEATQQYYMDNYNGDFLGISNVTDINAYSQKDFEPSPLNRVLKQAAPGEDWELNPSGEDHSIESAYLANTHNPLIPTDPDNDNVRMYTVSISFIDNTYIPALAFGTDGGGPTEFYAQGELYRTVTKDENHTGTSKNHTTEEFMDKQGRVLLKRTYADMDIDNNGTIGTGESEIPHDTYYVYDDYGNLTYVLPPKMEGSSGTLANLRSGLAALGYQYTYDHRNRLVEKQIPGKEKEYIIYNKLDQPILTQDANQRTKDANSDEWFFTKYDAYGRVAYSGIATTPENTTREAVQNEVDSHTEPLWTVKTTSGNSFGGTTNIYYDNGAYPYIDLEDPPLATLTEVLTINYYDNYDFLVNETGMGLPATVFEKILENYNNLNKVKTKGRATGRKVKVLGTMDWITSATGYDDKGRTIYMGSKNDYLATQDATETLLDFIGRPIKTKTAHIRNNNTITTIDNFTYDHVGRLLAQTQCIGDENMGDSCPNGDDTPATQALTGDISSIKQATQSITVTNATLLPGARLIIANGSKQELIAFNTYDKLGQLVNRKVGGTPDLEDLKDSPGLQKLDYVYNVRGWLRQINDPGDLGSDLFGFAIRYNDPTNFNVNENPDPLFNGNISQTLWKSKSQKNTSNLVSERYSYSYNAQNGITSAKDNTGNYNLSNVSYDKNGNIMFLKRQGHTVLDGNGQVTTFGVMDDLVYNYDSGNKLIKVEDLASIDQYGFRDDAVNMAADNDDDYLYDQNGNMTSDANKGITDIEYNHLNLPTKITINSNGNVGNIVYIYNATGVKLKKTTTNTATSSVTETDYAGNYVYGNDKLQFFNTPEGYVMPKDVNNYSQGFEYVYNYVDHLGNVRLSYSDSDNNGSIDPSTEIIVENNYYPMGLKHKGYNTNVSSLGNSTAQKWKFQGVELEDALGLDLYEMEFRSYDPAIGRFTSVDPLAEERNWLTPYNFVQNNPISRIDPTGLLDTYGINEDGKVTHIDDMKYYDGNGNEVDRLYAVDSNNEFKDTNNDDVVSGEDSVEVDKGVLDSKSSISVKTNRGKQTIDQYKVAGDGKAGELFEFVADNSNVEWSLTGIGSTEGSKGQNMVTTSHQEAGEAGGPYLEATGYTIRYSNHSHPYSNNASTGDRNFTSRINSKFPDARTKIYHNGNYTTYNQSGSIRPIPTITAPIVKLK